MSYEFWLGLRYLLQRRRERFVSVIALLSISERGREAPR